MIHFKPTRDILLQCNHSTRLLPFGGAVTQYVRNGSKISLRILLKKTFDHTKNARNQISNHV